MAYDRFYIDKMEGDEMRGAPLEVVEDFGIYVKSIPFAFSGNAKELPSNNWHDENGVDEYVPGELMMEPYDMEVEFCCKKTKERDKSVNDRVQAFLNYLRGLEVRPRIGLEVMGTGADFAIYDAHTGIGRKHVRLVSISDKAELFRDDGYEILVFSVTFRVNDPITNITLSKDE